MRSYWCFFGCVITVGGQSLRQTHAFFCPQWSSLLFVARPPAHAASIPQSVGRVEATREVNAFFNEKCMPPSVLVAHLVGLKNERRSAVPNRPLEGTLNICFPAPTSKRQWRPVEKFVDFVDPVHCILEAKQFELCGFGGMLQIKFGLCSPFIYAKSLPTSRRNWSKGVSWSYHRRHGSIAKLKRKLSGMSLVVNTKFSFHELI